MNLDVDSKLKKTTYSMHLRADHLTPLPLAGHSVGYFLAPAGWSKHTGSAMTRYAELLWGISGVGEVVILGQPFLIHPGDVVYYLPREEHHVKVVSDEGWEYRWLSFDGPLAAAIMTSYEYPRHIVGAGDCPTELFQEIEHLLTEKNDASARRSTALIMDLLARMGGQSKPTFDRTQILEHAVDLIERHHTDASFNIQKLAQRIGVHRTTLTRLYTQAFNRSPSKQLISRRAQHGLTLLAGTDLPIAEVAQRCGIPDLAYFGVIVRRSVGMSPTQYRQSQRPTGTSS